MPIGDAVVGLEAGTLSGIPAEIDVSDSESRCFEQRVERAEWFIRNVLKNKNFGSRHRSLGTRGFGSTFIPSMRQYLKSASRLHCPGTRTTVESLQSNGKPRNSGPRFDSR